MPKQANRYISPSESTYVSKQHTSGAASSKRYHPASFKQNKHKRNENDQWIPKQPEIPMKAEDVDEIDRSARRYQRADLELEKIVRNPLDETIRVWKALDNGSSLANDTLTSKEAIEAGSAMKDYLDLVRKMIAKGYSITQISNIRDIAMHSEAFRFKRDEEANLAIQQAKLQNERSKQRMINIFALIMVAIIFIGVFILMIRLIAL